MKNRKSERNCPTRLALGMVNHGLTSWSGSPHVTFTGACPSEALAIAQTCVPFGGRDAVVSDELALNHARLVGCYGNTFREPHTEHCRRSDTSGIGKLSGKLSTLTVPECPQLVSWPIADLTPCSRILPRLMGGISRPSAS
jgi:hypothetical protein